MLNCFRKKTAVVVIFPKDVAIFANCSIRTAQRILAAIRKACKKRKNGFVTVSEFCSYFQIEEKEWTNRMKEDK